MRDSQLIFNWPVKLWMRDGTQVVCPARSIFDRVRAEQIQGLAAKPDTMRWAAIWCGLQRAGKIPKVILGPDALTAYMAWLDEVEDFEAIKPPEETDQAADPTGAL